MKKLILSLITLGLVGFVLVSSSADPQSTNAYRIAGLVNEMESLTADQVEELPSIDMQPYTIPTASVDVMRVKLEETYTVEGVGEDTVELTGWIAVRHGAPRSLTASNEITWGNFIVDTEFVALKLQGESEIFGAVEVTLDGDRPAIGEVGSIEIPEAAHKRLAANREESTEESSTVVADDVLACRAPVNVAVAMPELGLEMKTANPAVWHSLVTTIPPVGHEASVTISPVPLTSQGREVGQLVSGTVKFREVVKKSEILPEPVKNDSARSL
jgi:hypothetical protein